MKTPIWLVLRLASAGILSGLMLAACGGKSNDDVIAAAKADMQRLDFSAAVVQLKTVLQAQNAPAEARFLLGVALLEQGQPQASLTELKKAEELQYDSELLVPKLARALMANGKFKEVTDGYSGHQLKSQVSVAELRSTVAVAYALQNRRPEAESALADALRAVPDYGPALLTKARMVAAQGDIDASLQLIDRAISHGAPTGESLMLKGNLLLRVKRNEADALKSFQAASQDPRLWLAAQLAQFNIHTSSKNVTKARAAVTEMQKKQPKAPQVMLADALTLLLEKESGRASEIVGQLLQLAPNNPQLLILGGTLDVQLGALLAAESKLGKAAQMPGASPVARKLLAGVYLRLGQPEKTLLTLRPLLEDARPDGDTLALAGQAHLQKGNVSKAESMLAAAAKLNPKDAQIQTALALADLLRGKAEAGLDALQRIAAADPGETADLALISTRMRRREFDAALEAVAALEKKQPRLAGPAFLRGQALRMKGDTLGARKAFDAALSLEPMHSASVLSLAALDAADGHPEAAVGRLEAALKANARDSGILVALAQLMDRQGAKPDAIRDLLQKGVKANPADGLSQTALIEHLIEERDFKAAVEVGQSAQLALPNNTQVLDALGRALVSSGDEMQAISVFSRIATLLPSSPGPHLRLGVLHARKGNIAARTESLKRAFLVAPDSPEARRQLVILTKETRDPKVALGLAKDLQKSRPASASGYMLEGEVEAARKNWPTAVAAYRQAVAKADRAAHVPVSLYLAYVDSGSVTEGDRFAADWARSHPKDTVFLSQMGSAALARKDLAGVERWFNALLKAEPDNATAMNNLAWVMTERRTPGAMAMAERASKAAPGSAVVADTLAGALLLEGQLSRAIEAQTRAVALDPKRSDYLLRLAQLHIKAGDKVMARAELVRLTSLKGEWAGKAKAGELLKSLDQ